MMRMRDQKRRRLAAPMAMESLEDRVVPSAAVAAVEIQYLRAMTQLNSLLQRRANQIQATMTRRVARADAQYVAALNRSASRLGGGSPAQAQQAQAQVARASAAADAKINQVAATVHRQLGAFTGQFNRKLAAVTNRFGALNRTIQGANPYFTATFKNALSAVDTGIPAEVQAAQDAVQAASAPVQSAVAQAQSAGGPAQAQANAEAAAGRLAETSDAQLAGEKAAVAQFWERYYSSFNPLRAEMAAIASMQLPPVRLGGGSVTGPQGQGGRSGGNNTVNGTGTGTVTFTGIPGGDATSGTGFGSASGVSGTAGTGNNAGTGTTTITGNGPGTTGVGSTVTSGDGANGTGIGSTTGVTGTTGVGSTVTAGNGANGTGIGSTTVTAGTGTGNAGVSPPMG
jgi:hypothetical protein